MADDINNDISGGVDFAPVVKPRRQVQPKVQEEVNPFTAWRRQQEIQKQPAPIQTTPSAAPAGDVSPFTEWRRQQDVQRQPETQTYTRQLPPIDIGKAPPITKKALDVARAAGTQSLLGLTADVPGAIGDISRLYESVSQMPYRGALKGAEFLGLLPKGKTAAEFEQEAKKIAPVSDAEEKGLVSSVYGVPFPTSAGMEKLETGIVPSLAYKGVSPEAQFTGRAARLGASMIPGGGGLAGAAERAGAGVLGSTIGQAGGLGVEELRKSGVTGLEPYTPYIEPALTMLGTGSVLGAAKSLGFGAKRQAAEEISGLMQRDIASGRVSPEEFRLAQQGQVPMADIFGPGTLTRSYLERQAGTAGEDMARAVEQYSLTTGKDVHGFPIREPQAQQATQQFLTQVHGAPISAPALTQAAQRTGAQIRQNLYNVARQDPAAAAIDASMFGLEQGRQTALIENPLMKGAINEAVKTSKSAPASWGIEAPVIDKKTGQTVKAGNLPFWDQVKRELDQQITNAMPSAAGPGNPSRVASLKPIRDQLVSSLDTIVPDYQRAREAALDTFRSASAPEAGMDFYKKMSAFDKNDAVSALSQMSPQGKQLFKSGFMHAMHDEVGSSGGISKIANKFIRDTDFQDKARLALGNDYDAIRGRFLVEDMTTKARGITPKAPPRGVIEKYGTGLGAALAVAADMAVQSQLLAPSHAAAFILGGGGTYARQMAQQSYLRRIADNAVEMMLSRNPEDHARLSQMMTQNPDFAKMVEQINTSLQPAEQPRKERQGRATGGYVTHGMTADMLIAAAERAKKQNQQTTKKILEAPDEHVAKALEVANQHI